MDVDLGLRAGGVDGVRDEVGDQPLDEHFVHLDEHFAGRDGDDFDLLFPTGPGQFDRALDHEIEPPEFQIQTQIFREEEGLADVGLHALDVAQRDRQEFFVKGLLRLKGDLQKGQHGCQEVVQIVGHPARHAPEEIEFLRLEDLRLQLDLVHDQTQIFHQSDEQVDVRGGEGFVGGFLADQEQAERLALRGEREAKLRAKVFQLFARLALDAVCGAAELMFLERDVLALSPLKKAEHRGVWQELGQRAGGFFRERAERGEGALHFVA